MREGLCNFFGGIFEGLHNYINGSGCRIRHYVIYINARKNMIIIGNEEDLWQSELIGTNLNKIIDLWPKRVRVKIRSTQPAQDATLEELKDGQVRVIFSNPVRAITPGQSVVFYQKDICLGGGTIL